MTRPSAFISVSACGGIAILPPGLGASNIACHFDSYTLFSFPSSLCPCVPPSLAVNVSRYAKTRLTFFCSRQKSPKIDKNRQKTIKNDKNRLKLTSFVLSILTFWGASGTGAIKKGNRGPKKAPKSALFAFPKSQVALGRLQLRGFGS